MIDFVFLLLGICFISLGTFSHVKVRRLKAKFVVTSLETLDLGLGFGFFSIGIIVFALGNLLLFGVL